MHALLKHKPTPKMTPYSLNTLLYIKKFSIYTMCDKVEINQCIPTLITKYTLCVILKMYFPLLSIIFHPKRNTNFNKTRFFFKIIIIYKK